MLSTRFTERFQVRHPIALAPMDLVSGGRLAAAVSWAGGLGIIGGGYGDRRWLGEQFDAAGNQPVGVGFITWSLARQPELMELCLARRPAAMFFSFGDAEPFVAQAQAAGIPTFWQVQRLGQVAQAHAAGVDAIVVQGQEAGGHGMDRGLMSLLPAARDLVGDTQVIVAAGGIADGRGLASALMLGADAVLMGTRFWAAHEADGPDQAKLKLVETGGDETLRTKVFDVVRDVDWPWHYTGRVLRNAFAERWHSDVGTLADDPAEERKRYEQADPEDFETRVVIGGEAVDLIRSVEPAAAIVDRTVADCAALLRQGAVSFLD